MEIVCFGDSNTYGYDPRGFFGDRYAPDARWVDLLAAFSGWKLVNDGVNGREIPFRIPSLQMRGDIILVMLGTNDLLQGNTALEAAEKMEAFLTRLLKQDPTVLLIAPPPMVRGAWVPTDALVHQSTLLAEQYQTIAEKLSVFFIDTRPWNIPLAFDGVHFTETGHRIFAENLFPVLNSYLQENAP